VNGKKPSSVREQVESLVAIAKELDLSEVLWEEGDRKVAFTRRTQARPPAPVTAAPKPAAPAAPKTHFITAPFVGTFLRAPKDRPPLVVEGEEVESGDKVGIVEAMKVPRDVTSHVAGHIVKILVENGKPVEYGQKIFEVEPK
jgi:acetyl-CoA carboxylase biotin carboxyl carrier protein